LVKSQVGEVPALSLCGSSGHLCAPRGEMSSAVRLLGPDLNSALTVNVDAGCSYLQIKEAALAAWPAGAALPARRARRPRRSD
jgi:hypothetical protein